MNKNIAVIYFSKYGATMQYAKWIAEKLECQLFDMKNLDKIDYLNLDTIIFGSGLYAGKINYKNIFESNINKKLVVYTVGLSDPNTTDYQKIIDDNFNFELKNKIKFFHLRGGINYKKLTLIDKLLMFLLKKLKLDQKPEQEKTLDEVLMGETYGKEISFINKDTIIPIIEYIKGVNKA